MAVASFLVYLAFMFYMICISVLGQQQNIAIGSTLNTSPASKWVSPNGDFAFGFFKTTPGLYLVGVWFDKIPPKTVAWTANRDDPVKEGSSLQISNRGVQIIRSGATTAKMIIGVDQQTVRAAAMKDDGNFVLFNTSNGILWQSFGHPTDTLLPGQVFHSGSILVSKSTDNDYSRGQFLLALQDSLKLSPVDRRLEPYWSPQTDNAGNPSNLTFETNGLLSLVWPSGKNTLWDATGAGSYKRVTLDEHGGLQGYTYQGNSWTVDWKTVDDLCQVRGQCGLNGICDLTNNSPECNCPPGFDFMDSDNHFKGCFRSAPQQNCSLKSTMQDIGNTDWPENDYASLSDISETECKQACLDDCACIVVVYGHMNGKAICWKKAIPLRDGRLGANRATFVKIPEQREEMKRPRKEKKRWVLASIGLSLFCFSSILATVSVIVCLRESNSKFKVEREQHELTGGLKSFKYTELEKATGYFQEELGKGASGKVYKGKLPDGRAIAVKKLNEMQRERFEMSEKEFRTEMSIIAASHHKNLVQLYGFCDEGCHRLLVYEFLNNGSLDKALFEGTCFLDWKQRVQIILGTARGILYLHQECETQILHCDIKPQNILLDENYNAKISDFGIAKLIGAEQTRTFTEARGTIGYMAPEWQRNMAVTAKVDVYSFGVMLLEIICQRKMVESDKPENEIILCEWVYECLKDGGLQKIVEEQRSVNQERIDVEEMERMVLVGLWCIQEDPFLRPSIKNVVQMLEGTVEMAVPPCPGTSLERPVLAGLQI